MSETVLVTGGCGYIGASLCKELLDTGRHVRTLDVLLHGQGDVAEELRRAGVEVLTGDVRDSEMVGRAVGGAHAIVHLAAVVGDPACAKDPVLSHEVNVEGSRALIAAAEHAGVRLFAFASTCSNYGRMADATVPITEGGDLAPVSLYAEQKVGDRKGAPERSRWCMATVCLRLATVYGVAPRMRFDLTVNEFTRDMWADRHLEVFGEQFWRPYIHVRDAGERSRLVLDAPLDAVEAKCSTSAASDQNFRKLDLVEISFGRGFRREPFRSSNATRIRAITRSASTRFGIVSATTSQ